MRGQEELSLQHRAQYEQSVEARCPRENLVAGFLVEHSQRIPTPSPSRVHGWGEQSRYVQQRFVESRDVSQALASAAT